MSYTIESILKTLKKFEGKFEINYKTPTSPCDKPLKEFSFYSVGDNIGVLIVEDINNVEFVAIIQYPSEVIYEILYMNSWMDSKTATILSANLCDLKIAKTNSIPNVECVMEIDIDTNRDYKQTLTFRSDNLD